jgi:hypothetical protein
MFTSTDYALSRDWRHLLAFPGYLAYATTMARAAAITSTVDPTASLTVGVPIASWEERVAEDAGRHTEALNEVWMNMFDAPPSRVEFARVRISAPGFRRHHTT